MDIISHGWGNWEWTDVAIIKLINTNPMIVANELDRFINIIYSFGLVQHSQRFLDLN
ncbi:hypothetical protein J7K19_10385 [bacterium]|nr:hypothetical protein [bacterium]